MSFSISVSGINAILSNLDAGLQLITNTVDDSIQGAGINTEGGAKQRAPVDTGRFRAGYQYQKTGVCRCQVGNPVKYGPFLEFGTRHMRAQPSLWPATMDAVKTLQDELKAMF